MRNRLIAGNWKMNTSRNEALALASAVADSPATEGVEVVIFPPFVWLEAIARAIPESHVEIGAQDCSSEEKGAFTGQVSPQMLAELCSWVIVGHSERRRDAGESDDLVGRKAAAALSAGLKPVVCVGESLESREAGQQQRVVGAQVEALLEEVANIDASGLVIAYEPVWAIGTGRSATAQDAQHMAAFIRERISSQLGDECRVLYGGSVTPENAAIYLAEPDVDGLLVGGASLKPEQFLGIIKAC